ncbi:hypothetical protein CHS0354_021054 [Potamilus streckersoni]|uniref:Uncharacterized protein n=1 Tax=Potamilus streckersoni TaxID=2493646 RepID=A0AAE0SDZ8_9BIVA|nr:hypothetical protein CHS0354_021054 [Potamilus streckersoni]
MLYICYSHYGSAPCQWRSPGKVVSGRSPWLLLNFDEHWLSKSKLPRLYLLKCLFGCFGSNMLTSAYVAYTPSQPNPSKGLENMAWI